MPSSYTPIVERHKTALTRTDLSRPVRQALDDAVITPARSIFDYGCGRGGDVRRLAEAGFNCVGWDPNYWPDTPRAVSDVVNLGFVVNVIEDPAERAQTLQAAWSLAGRALVIAARMKEEAKGLVAEELQDGVLTQANTFQKFYEQSELRAWIDAALGASAVAAAPGIFYVFKHDEEREAFLAQRYRRRTLAPMLRRSDELFEQHRATLEPLMAFVADRGRLPAGDELSEAQALRSTFATLRQAFRIVLRVTGEEQWEEVKLERSEDLLVYLGLARFGRRPRMSQLSRAMQLDVKAFFGSYTRACDEADELLLALGERSLLDNALSRSRTGKSTAGGLYVHQSALPSVPTLLRTYEGCARGFLGAVEGANIVKLHRGEAKVSYLSYPDFEVDPHPALKWSVVVDLRTFRSQFRSYEASSNPPVLHRKELFVADDYALREKFVRLTTQEERAGLYAHPESIGTHDGWAQTLASNGVALRGHRVVRRKR